jgi:hypothetical protein
MHSNLDILAGSLVRRLTPIKYPPFPLTVKSMRGTYLRFDMSALIITGVSTGEER